jgi:hypothetical protein
MQLRDHVPFEFFSHRKRTATELASLKIGNNSGRSSKAGQSRQNHDGQNNFPENFSFAF